MRLRCSFSRSCASTSELVVGLLIQLSLAFHELLQSGVNRKALTDYYSFYVQQLDKMVQLVRGELTKLQRATMVSPSEGRALGRGCGRTLLGWNMEENYVEVSCD